MSRVGSGLLGGFTPFEKTPFPSLSKASASLFFQDGSCVLGESIGAQGSAEGELVFTTSTTGFQESLTDPSYAGQILAFAYPLIGNYGVSESAFESFEDKIRANAVVVKEACAIPSHYASRKSLSQFLKDQGVAGIAGVDTRAVVQRIREHGVLPCALETWRGSLTEKDFASKHDQALKKLKKFDYSSVNFVELVSEKKKQVFTPKRIGHRIALMDYGAKASIVRELLKRNCEVAVFPHSAKAEEVAGKDFDGIMLSNGPGDPALLTKEIAELRKMVLKKPVFGICLGHQLLACAFGAKTFKLKFGHRGANHAVKSPDGRAFVTTQNHGFSVDSKSLPKTLEETLVDCLDGTNEGLRHKDLPVFSIQFHAEANPGPYDANFFFEEFLKMVK